MKRIYDKSVNSGTLRRGFTLVELSVTIAILAIVSVMVISFCAYIGVRTKVTQYNNDVVEDCTQIDYVVSNWMACFDRKGCTFRIDNNDVVAKDENKQEYRLTYKDNVLSGETYQTVNGVSLTYSYTVTAIDTLEFNPLGENSNQTRCLLTYRIEYEKKTVNNKTISRGTRLVSKTTHVATVAVKESQS